MSVIGRLHTVGCLGLGTAALLLLGGRAPAAGGRSAAQAQAGQERADGRVVGKVLFPDGTAPRAATVHLSANTAQVMNRSTPAPRQARVCTDGTFVLDGVPPWRLGWTLSVAGKGFVAPPPYLRAVAVSPGERVRLDVTVCRGGVVTGRITRAQDGQPVRGAVVSFTEQDPPVETRSGRDGRYRLDGVLPGMVSVSCWAEGFAGAGSASALVRERRESAGMDVALHRGCLIAGTVVTPDGKTPAARASVRLIPLMATGAGQVVLATLMTDDAGAFCSDPLPPGTFRLEVAWPAGKGVAAPTHRAVAPRVVGAIGRTMRSTVTLKPIGSTGR